MQQKLFLFIIQFIILFNQSKTSARALIGRNVREANETEFPSIVCILSRKHREAESSGRIGRNILCGGALITSTHILSAGHCADDFEKYIIEIIIGSNDIRQGTIHKVMWWITFKQWATTFHKRPRYKENDISMIKLIHGASSQIVLLQLSHSKKKDLFGLNAELAGWGQLENKTMPMTQHTVTVKILPDSECAKLPARFGEKNTFFSKAELCSIANPYALLECGDSGGPIIVANEIVGINIGTCPEVEENTFDPNQANLHASIFFYREFISDTTAY